MANQVPIDEQKVLAILQDRRLKSPQKKRAICHYIAEIQIQLLANMRNLVREREQTNIRELMAGVERIAGRVERTPAEQRLAVVTDFVRWLDEGAQERDD